jgi:HPt (histidine-containing phosphotransfer) domain-containing protein
MCPKLMSALRLALERKDSLELAALSHALKGTIANFTDGAAFQSALKIEQLAKEADLYRAAEAFKRLEDDVETLLTSLKSFASAVPKA